MKTIQDDSLLPKVSIIIPAYNSGKFIHVLLDSLVQQTNKNFELIVVDDGSTDDTSKVVLDYQSSQQLPVKLIQQVNSGVSSARNAGLDNARGEFCLFIDSDDFVDNHFIEKLLARQSETDADIVYCGCNKEGKKGYTHKPETFFEGDLLIKRITREVLFHLGGVLIRKSFLTNENIKFNTDLALGEDLLFTYTLLSKKHIYAVPEYLYYQTYRDDSVMNSSWPLSRYKHNAYSMEEIYRIMNMQSGNADNVMALLKKAVTSAKIKFMWKLLSFKEYTQATKLLNEGYLNISKTEFLTLSKKDLKKYKIIKSKNKILWFIYFLIKTK